MMSSQQSLPESHFKSGDQLFEFCHAVTNSPDRIRWHMVRHIEMDTHVKCCLSRVLDGLACMLLVTKIESGFGGGAERKGPCKANLHGF